jgi:hypothetical protein
MLTLITGDERDVVVVQSRLAVAKTTGQENEGLLSLWPPVACYGMSGGGEDRQALQTCEKYVQRYMLAGSEAAIPAGVVRPVCQTVPSQP